MNERLYRKLRLKRRLPKDKPWLLKGCSALKLFPDEPFLYCRYVDEIFAHIRSPEEQLIFYVGYRWRAETLDDNRVAQVLKSHTLESLYSTKNGQTCQERSLSEVDLELLPTYLPRLSGKPCEVNFLHGTTYRISDYDQALLIHNPAMVATLKILNHEPPEKIREFLLLHRSRIDLIMFYSVNNFWRFFTGYGFDLPPVEDFWSNERELNHADGPTQRPGVSADLSRPQGAADLLS